MNNFFKHLKIIHTHRKYVRRICFKMSLYWQGLVHDLSKYSPVEFSIYKYYSGKRSPHQECREILGYSPSWIHHYHKNKHHYQYWWDEDEFGKIIPMKMPYKYVIESFCDMVGASKAYNKDNWEPQLVQDYWDNKCKGKRIQHFESSDLTQFLIYMLVQKGEEGFCKWYKENKKKLEADYERGTDDQDDSIE